MSINAIKPYLAAPANIHELRNLVIAISRNEVSISMGPKALSVLGRLVEQPELAAVSTITELAQALEVNASTLSRLARSLGYGGFAEFQRIFRDAVTSSVGRFYSGQASRLIKPSDGSPQANACLNTVAQLFKESVSNIEGCLAQLDNTELHEAAICMAQATRIRIYGVRQIHSIASSLVYGLNLIRPDVALLDSPGHGIAESLSYMDKNDVLIVASTEPYSRIVAQAAALANEVGITVIAITDYRTSPLAINADYTFIVPHQSSFISNSIGAYIVLCEGLVNLVARQLGTKALQALKRHESFINRLHIETG